jgi:hypothetical protein
MVQVAIVTPAEAGVQKFLKNLDSGFRRNDGVRALAIQALVRLSRLLKVNAS